MMSTPQMPACTNYRTLLNMDFKVPTAALPRATDIKLINDQRFVDITQIGVNTRSHADLEKITFDGEDAMCPSCNTGRIFDL